MLMMMMVAVDVVVLVMGQLSFFTSGQLSLIYLLCSWTVDSEPKASPLKSQRV